MEQLNSRNRSSWAFIIAFAALFATLFAYTFSMSGYCDSDYFWHTVLGKYIVENKSIPKDDIFSWLSIEKGYQETAHSWLGSVILYYFSIITNNVYFNGVIFVWITFFIMAVCIQKFWGTVFTGIGSTEIQNITWHLIILSYLTAMGNMAARPKNFGLILFTVSLYLMFDAYKNPQSKKIWFVPLISLFWANLHGGTIPILFAFLAMFTVLTAIPDFNFFGVKQSGHSLQQTKKFALVLILSILAALVNPYGYKLFIYFFVTNNSATKQYVNEWRHSYLYESNIVMAIAALALVFLTKSKAENRNIRLENLAAIGATFVMSAKYARIQEYLLVCNIAFCAQYLQDIYAGQTKIDPVGWILKKFQKGKYSTEKEQQRLTPLSDKDFKALSVMLLFFAVLISSVGLISAAETIEPPASDLSAELCEAITELNPQRMYTSYNSGGYVIYHGFKSFIDSRADPFDGDVLIAGINFQTLSFDAEEELDDFLEKYDFDSILIEKRYLPTNLYLEQSADWELVSADDNYALYSKN